MDLFYIASGLEECTRTHHTAFGPNSFFLFCFQRAVSIRFVIKFVLNVGLIRAANRMLK